MKGRSKNFSDTEYKMYKKCCKRNVLKKLYSSMSVLGEFSYSKQISGSVLNLSTA